MTTYADRCDDARLRLLLSGPEDSAEFHAAASHIEDCEPCRARLSELAAGADEWTETRRLLHRDDSDRRLADECQGRSWTVSTSTSGTLGQRPGGSVPWTASLAGQFLAPPSHPEMLGRLGRYEIERLIGTGGMGVVFKGFDTELNRPVAIKMLAPHLAGSGAARQRFAREARAAAAVVHEHVVAIHDVESESPAPFLVMQFVSGESLQARLDRQGPLELCELLRIARQTAAGLAAAHAQGLVHRDVKPSNILLEHGVDRALLSDFGLARASDDASLTHTGHLPGTPHYMSPEQSRGEPVDGSSDLFSLGSVMYAMATGRPPFRADTSLGVLRRITDSDPHPVREINAAIPAWLAAVITRLHAKSPAQRFSSASQVAAILETCLAHVQQPTVVPLPPECQVVSHRPRGSRRLLAAGLASVGIVLAVVTWQARHGNRPNRTDTGPSPLPATAPGEFDSDLATDWYAVEQQIGELDQEWLRLEPSMRQVWGMSPSVAESVPGGGAASPADAAVPPVTQELER